MRKINPALHWPVLAGKFLAGQGLILFINLLVGFLFLRALPKSEYALYISAGTLLAIASLGSDLGLSQALNSLGARFRGDKGYLGALYAAAYSSRRKFFILSSLVSVCVALFMFHGGEWGLWNIAALIPIVLLTAWVQCEVSLRKSVLNIHHAASALFYAGIWEAVVRIGLVLVCFVWPTALAALGIGLIGLLAGRFAIVKVSADFMQTGAYVANGPVLELRKFIIPLIPGVVYYLVQGQVSIFLLNVYGYTSAVAEVGALGRLGQLVGLLLMLNPFLLQPSFARIDSRKIFVRRALLVSGALLAFSLICLASVALLPHWWLFLLGENYAGLGSELPIAIIGSLLTVIGAAIYTMVISRNFTKGQAWAIAGGMGSQVLFLLFVGIHNTMDALVLNVLPLATYAGLQLFLLLRVIKHWGGRPGGMPHAGVELGVTP